MRDLARLFKTEVIYDKLGDEISKIIFESRLEYLYYRDKNKLIDQLIETIDEFYCKDFQNFMNEDKEIIIFGAGLDGKRANRVLKKMGYIIKAFCDNNRNLWNTKIDEVPVISLDELVLQYPNQKIIITSKNYVDKIYEELLCSGIKREFLYYPMYRELVAGTGNQYFDLPYWKFGRNEVFIDAGSYDAEMAIEFAKCCNDLYDKIYCFEAHPKFADHCKKRISDAKLQNVIVLPNGTWSKNETLYFNSNGGAGSGIRQNGDIKIDAISIDEAVGKEKVTLIKMDVEGSELESLKGARKTILRNKPKLAICVYHKPEDIVEIPSYLLSLIPEYKLWLRHYASNEWETVLYASL